MKFIKEYIFPLFMLIVSSIGGWWLADSGFDSVMQMRQLERVPATRVGAILPGEVNITATAIKYQDTVSSFYTHTPSLYYKYTEEIEETDSDGDTHWKTVHLVTNSVDFYVKDITGKALVNRESANINWSIPESFQLVRGDHRYTEYRLEENQTVFIFAMADLLQDKPIINFSSEGEYSPIISKYSEAEERSDMGITSILKIWVGITLMSLCVYFIAYLLRIHRLVKYLSILTIVLTMILVDMGLTMMHDDLKSGLMRYELQENAAKLRVEDLLARNKLSIKDWSDLGLMNSNRYQHIEVTDREKVKEIRLNLLFAREQVVSQMRAFPERWLVGIWNYMEPDQIVIVDSIKNKLSERMNRYEISKISSFWPGIFTITGLLLALVFSWFGVRKVKLKRYIENVSTSSTSGVMYGVCEVKGKLVSSGEAALESPLSESNCGWYHYRVEERRGSGKNAHWVTIEEKTEAIEFYCEDNEGRIKVDTLKAEVITNHRMSKRKGGLRYSEETLNIDDDLYVIGYANLNNNMGSELMIGYSSNREPFIISNQSENEVMISKARAGIFNLNMAFSSVVLSVLLLFGMSGGFAATDFLMSALIAPFFMLLIMMILHYNDIIFLKQRVERNRSNIEVSLKKRYNLLPNIESIVAKYTEHEAGVLKEITEYRSVFKQSIKDINKFDKLLDKQKLAKISINALQEKYPELKSNELFEKMMDIIKAMEVELMYMRTGYNDAVEVYNARIQTIPDIVFTSLFDFKEKDFIKR